MNRVGESKLPVPLEKFKQGTDNLVDCLRILIIMTVQQYCGGNDVVINMIYIAF